MAKTILIVEDDRALARMWTELLSAEGFDVVAEKDGEWALKTFSSRDVDLVILDVLVPVRNGFQIAERIRKMPGGDSVGILLISGIYRSAHHKREAKLKYRVLDYLDKPVKNEALLSIIAGFFGDEYPSKAAAEKERERVEKAPAEDFADEASKKEVAEVEETGRFGFRGAGVGRGDLRDQPFPELIAELYRWKSSGALLLKRGRVKKIVYFKDGYPIFVKSNLLGECLGKVMVRERMITEEQCEESLSLMRSSGRMQGTVLIEMGLISPHNLVFALELQLRVKLLEIFKWEEGRYQFTANADVPAQTVTLDVPPAALILEGVREHWSLSRAKAALGPVDDQYVVAASEPLYRFQELELDARGDEFVRRVNGRRTVQDLIERGPLDRESAYQLLYSLEASQVVSIQETRAKRSDAVSAGKAKAPPTPPPLPPERGSGSGALLPEVSGLAPSGGGADERALKTRLTDQLKQMRKQTYFEMLGVARTAAGPEIKKAYFALAREYHPDKIAGSMGDEVKQLAGEVYDLVTRAYEVLSDEGERAAYVKQISKGNKKKEVSDEVSKILAAEGKFQRGETFLRKDRYHDAYAAFREAVDLYPEEGEFHAYLGWSLFQTAPGDGAVEDEAVDHIMRAIQLNPKVDKAYLFLGYIYKAGGRLDKAEKQFEKAIQCNPDCTEALRELRLSGQRS